MINDAQRRDLIDLRQQITSRNHEQIQFLVKRLLLQIEFFYALSVVVEQAYSLLDLFESYYPEETWVRQMLLQVTTFGVAPEDSVAEMALSQPFHVPGMGNYIKAVYDLTQAMQAKHGYESRIGYMTSALANLVMAELVEAWYGDEDDLWQLVRAEPDTPENLMVAYQFWIDPTTAQLDQQNWQRIADSLEKLLIRAPKK